MENVGTAVGIAVGVAAVLYVVARAALGILGVRWRCSDCRRALHPSPCFNRVEISARLMAASKTGERYRVDQCRFNCWHAEWRRPKAAKGS